MIRRLLAISSNTFVEILRQPIYGIVIAATILLLVFAPSLTMYSLDDDNYLLKDIGLSTLLVAGLFLAVFASASVITDEIENKTVLTVVTKSVSRTTFIVGKFLGVVLAVLLAQYLLSLTLLMVTRHGVMQRASDDPDWPVIWMGIIVASATFLIGMVGNYLYRWRFSSTAVVFASIGATLAIAALSFIDPTWAFNPAENHIPTDMFAPILLVVMATIIITSIAIAAATRLGMIPTLSICLIIFVLGACVNYWIGPAVTKPGVLGYLAWGAVTIIPSIDIFVVTNAIFEEAAIPPNYLVQTGLYTLLYVVACLSFAIALFKNREIG